MQHLQHGSFIHKGDQIMAYFKCSSARAEVKPTKSFTVGLSLSVEKNSNNHAYGTAYVPETIKIGENLYKVSDGVRHVSTWTSQVANVSNSKYITYILQK